MIHVFRCLFGLLLLLTSINPTNGCTVFMVSADSSIYGATNKDWWNLDTRMFVVPAGEHGYGIIYFGYQISEGFQNVGGINDQGLWYDGASLKSRNDIENHNDKPSIQGELCEKALRECATVEEVIELYKTYYTPHWSGHSMWADRSGNSVVIEFGDEDVVFISRSGNFQLMTNFPLFGATGNESCKRYKRANEVLSANNLQFNTLIHALETSSQNGLTNTVYSSIYDLTKLKVWLFNYHNYDEFVEVNLQDLLENGKANISIRDQFHHTRIKQVVSGIEENSSNIQISWSGNAEMYQLFVSTDSLFKDTIPQVFLKDSGKSVQNCTFPWVFIIVVAGGMIFIKLSKTRTLSYLILICAFLFVKCEKLHIPKPYPKSEFQYEAKINTTSKTCYYLKIVGSSSASVTESPVKKVTSL